MAQAARLVLAVVFSVVVLSAAAAQAGGHGSSHHSSSSHRGAHHGHGHHGHGSKNPIQEYPGGTPPWRAPVGTPENPGSQGSGFVNTIHPIINGTKPINTIKPIINGQLPISSIQTVTTTRFPVNTIHPIITGTQSGFRRHPTGASPTGGIPTLGSYGGLFRTIGSGAAAGINSLAGDAASAAIRGG